MNRPSSMIEGLEQELRAWRDKLEYARLQLHLGRLDLLDREERALRSFEPSYQSAMHKLHEVGQGVDERTRALRGGVEAGWKELRTTYRGIREQQVRRERPGSKPS